MNFTKRQMSLIIGSILGDGYITKYKEKKYNSQLTIEHSEKQLDYLKWKRQLFIDFGFKVSKIYNVSRAYPSFRFNVILGEDGNILRHQLYPNGNKTITRHHLNYLDELGLAIWFMDDGTKQVSWKKDGSCSCRALHISTHNFTYKEQELMVKYLKIIWNVEVKIYKDRKKFRLNINATNAKIFINIIKPHIHPTMKYKIDLMYKN